MSPPKHNKDVRWAASTVGVPVDRVRKLIREEGLPAVQIGPRSLRFSEDEVLAWVASRRLPPPETVAAGAHTLAQGIKQRRPGSTTEVRLSTGGER